MPQYNHRHRREVPVRVSKFMWLASVGCLMACAARGQSASQTLPAFDAASVRTLKSPPGGWGPPDMDRQYFRMAGAPLRFIIKTAYGIDYYQLTGLPDWTNNEYFAIEATTETSATHDQMLLMLRRLLAERFQLRLEESEKEQPVWAIVVAPGGPKMKPRADDDECPRGISTNEAKAAGAPPNSSVGFNGCTMADLVKAFNQQEDQVGRPVIDKTGLTGRYHMLVWQEIEIDDTSTGPVKKTSYMEPFRRAVQEELGLKLVEGTGSVRRIHVVSISRPTPN
jgi:uncharacterized protein (TIGR03435 family)